MAYESRETAAFNLAMPYLMRVNKILDSNYTVFKQGDARTFAINLRQLYRELFPWLVVDAKKNINHPQEFIVEFEELSKIPQLKKELLWNKMEKIENMLRSHFRALGMLMPKVSDPRFLFGNKQK